METLTLQGKHPRKDGGFDTFWTLAVESKVSLLPWQKRGLSFTASGYGSHIPTDRMVKFNGRWRRVYCCVLSNSGTCYIGKSRGNDGEVILVMRA